MQLLMYNESAGPITLAICDDLHVWTRGIAESLNDYNDIEVVGTASNAAEALRLTSELLPDALLLDYRMPEMDGAAAIPKLKEASPATKIIMLSQFATMYDVAETLRADTHGLLSKYDSIEDIHSSVVAAVRHNVPTMSQLAQESIQLRQQLPKQPDERQLEIIRLVQEGLTDAQIAKRLYVQESTVKKHLNNLNTMLGTANRNRTELVHEAQRLGYI